MDRAIGAIHLVSEHGRKVGLFALFPSQQHWAVKVQAFTDFCLRVIDQATVGSRCEYSIVWELIAEDAGNGRTRYTNRVNFHPTDVFMALACAAMIKEMA